MNHGLERLSNTLFEPLHAGAAAAIAGGQASSPGYLCFQGLCNIDGVIEKDYGWDPDPLLD